MGCIALQNISTTACSIQILYFYPFSDMVMSTIFLGKYSDVVAPNAPMDKFSFLVIRASIILARYFAKYDR